MAYDSSMGACLGTLHSRCSDVVVKLTAADLVNIFPLSMGRTKSQELKVVWIPHLFLFGQGLKIIVLCLFILLA